MPYERRGRVLDSAQSVEQSASPLTAFLIGPVTQLVFIPFMTDEAGADAIGGWFGTGADRGIALGSRYDRRGSEPFDDEAGTQSEPGPRVALP